VFKNGILTPWLRLKLSSIKNSGLGVFLLQNFKEGEFITAYLGEVNKNPLDEEYTFKKINGKPVKSASGLLEDYCWVIKFSMEAVIKSMLLLQQDMKSRQRKTSKLVKSFLWITTDP